MHAVRCAALRCAVHAVRCAVLCMLWQSRWSTTLGGVVGKCACLRLPARTDLLPPALSTHFGNGVPRCALCPSCGDAGFLGTFPSELKPGSLQPLSYNRWCFPVERPLVQTWADTFISELNDTHVEAELRTKNIPPAVSSCWEWSVYGACLIRRFTLYIAGFPLYLLCRSAQPWAPVAHALPPSHSLLPTCTPLSHPPLACFISTFTSEREAVGCDKP